MRYAVLDVGTNSVKLLVADFAANDLIPLLEDSETTRLGQDVGQSRRLRAEAIQRTVEVAGRFAERARKLQAERLLAFATSALRDASNRNEFLEKFQARTGFDCQVISGDEEAELIFLGATSHAALRTAETIVFDIGGGSIEFIRGKSGKIDSKVSLDCGAVRLTEAFLKSDPPSQAELAAANQHLRTTLHSAIRPFAHSPTPLPLLGTGGTIGCLASMDLKLPFPDPKRIDGHRFRLERLIELREQLSALPLAERKQIRGLPPQRADIIVAGAAILVVGIQTLGHSEITVSARNLRHGAVLRDPRKPIF